MTVKKIKHHDFYNAFYGDFLPNVIVDSIKRTHFGAVTSTALSPSKIYHNREAGVTTVLWNDGTKTIVRRSEYDPEDLYAAYCIALAKKVYGSNSALKRDLDRCVVMQESKRRGKEA